MMTWRCRWSLQIPPNRRKIMIMEMPPRAKKQQERTDGVHHGICATDGRRRRRSRQFSVPFTGIIIGPFLTSFRDIPLHFRLPGRSQVQIPQYPSWNSEYKADHILTCLGRFCLISRQHQYSLWADKTNDPRDRHEAAMADVRSRKDWNPK